ncbi:MAG: hypothetical protein CL955_06770 [Erythrobacteraceae bacterium]|nr:hypothetical protein [Erythrobacteraceae bacterium]
MGQENLGVDLFGNPVLPRREGAGRPAVEWDQIVSTRVLLAFVRGWGVAKTAKHVGLSSPTLRKVYFSECAMRTTAHERMEMRQLERLNAQAEAGNVAAEKELARRIEQLRMRDRSAEMTSRPPAKEAPKLGKKEAADKAAREQRGIFAPPPAPHMVQ